MKILLTETEIKRAVAFYMAHALGDIFPLSSITLKAKLIENGTNRPGTAFDVAEIDAGDLIHEDNDSTAEIARKPRNIGVPDQAKQ